MTFDEARLVANIHHRAQLLFENGYRARWREAGRLEIRSGKGAVYLVDTEAGACDCPFYRAHQGRHPCKHGLGWRRLLARQRTCRLWLCLLLLRAWRSLDDAPRGGRSD